MASDETFVRYVVDQFEDAGVITFKKMFGEYGIYADGKMFALVCDNNLFIKPTAAGRAFIADVVEAPPYPGAKPAFLIEEKLEDTAWLSELARITLKALPPPKPRRKKSRGKE